METSTSTKWSEWRAKR